MAKICDICQSDNSKTVVLSGKRFNHTYLCNKHYQQMSKKGFISDKTPSRRLDKKVCDICKDTHKVWMNRESGKYQGMLLCNKHRLQLRKNGEIVSKDKSHLRTDRVCNYCQKSKGEIIYHKNSKQMLCRKHYDHIYTYGKILKRTKYSSNEIIEYDNFAEMIVYSENNEEVARTTIDKSMIEKVSKYKWGLGGHGYIYTSVGADREYLALHQLIMKSKNTEHLVDHRDRNPLNNLRSNLRLANKSINSINTGLRNNNKSGVTGVSFSSSFKRWRAYISYNKKRIELGYFLDKEDAIVARLKAEVKYYPNQPPQKHLFEKHDIKGDARHND